MDINLARHVVRAAFRSERELEELMQMLKAYCSVEEYKKLCIGHRRCNWRHQRGITGQDLFVASGVEKRS